MIFKKVFDNLKPFLIYDFALLIYLIIVYGIGFFLSVFFVEVYGSVLYIAGAICFYIILIALFVKLGYSKNIKIGMILFELKLIAYPVQYMIYMTDTDMLPSPISLLTLGNIMYGDIKPITKLISDVNYNALICIPDLLLSLVLPALSLYIGYLIKKKTSEKSEV
ncbi:MAG: hypothetical protein K2K42_01135 [Eubacterium sp.]|nr:hypothetical protein [Eubacterium sp.]